MSLRLCSALSTCLLLLACSRENTSSPVSAPGADERAKTQALEVGADLLQRKAPLAALNAYLDGFHFYSGNMQGQMEAHHYCGHLNEDLIQCVIFDGNDDDAKIMGIEYIVTEKLFAGLPEEEKKLWHSHVHEVKSGQLVAPGIPQVAEKELMEQLVGTYGKTWHTWHTDRGDALPLGGPMLMMGFTQDGQIRPELVTGRDKRMNLSSAQKREQRSDIPAPTIDPGADAWQKGAAMQLRIEPVTQDSAAHR